MRCAKLTIRSPSATTTSYTVSNAPLLDSRLLLTVRGLSLALRIFSGAVCLILFALQCKQNLSAAKIAGGMPTWDVERVLAAFITERLGEDFAAGGKTWWVMPATNAIIIWAVLRRDYIEESLLVVRGMGIQTSTSSRSYLSSPTTRFIPTSQIQDIFIHEAFIGFEVKFYLAIVIGGDVEAVVVFPQLLPHRDVLEDVWRGTRATLGWTKSPS